MSKFTDKVKAFLKDIEGDAVGAEKHVVAWFHNIFASHTAGNTPAPPAQAGATPPAAPVVAVPVAATPYVNPNPPVAHPPAVNSGAPPVQAGSVVPTPNPPAGATVVGAVPGAQASAAPVTGVPAANGSIIPGKMTPIATNVAIDAPDAKGLVAFTGLPTTNAFSGVRIGVEEVGLALPPGSQERETCMNAVGVANAKYGIQDERFIGVATDSVEVDNPATGGKDWKTASPAVNIPNSLALPAMTVSDDGQSFDTSKILGAYNYLLYQGNKAQRGPVTDQGFGSPVRKA